MPVEGNTRLIYAAKQTAKGSPAAAPTQVFPLSGDAALSPNRSIITLPETDASSQEAEPIVVGASPGGGWQGWLRRSHMPMLSEGIMGTIATTGVGPFVDTATPSKILPYYTFWDVIPGVQCTRYDDCRFSSLTVASQAEQGATYSVEAVALSALLNQAEPTLALPTDTKYGHSYLKVTIGGSWPGTHDTISITINRSVSLLRGDMGLAIFDSHPGLFAVSGESGRIYTNDDLYNQLHGGTAAATTLTRTVFGETLSILFEETAGSASIEFVSSQINYREVTSPVNVDGSPLIQAAQWTTRRQATWSNNMTIITKRA